MVQTRIRLPIASAINHQYVLPLTVMLASLKQHLQESFEPVLYLVHAGLDCKNLDIIASIVETHSIVPSEAQLSAVPSGRQFPREAAFPLLLPELISEVPQILFLDADLLVLDDVGKLWETTSLDGHVLAAVADTAVPRCSSHRGVKEWQSRGIPPEAPYFNCGVLLIDLVRWRKRDVGRRAYEYFDTVREPVDFLHQEALNAVLWTEWKQLDPRWNLLASRAGRAYGPNGCQAWRQPGIVHFAGRMKPWRAPVGGPFNAPYRQVLEQLLPLLPARPPNLRERVCSAYDRYLRSVLFPVEQYLWNQRYL